MKIYIEFRYITFNHQLSGRLATPIHIWN